ncbi:glycosyltransferase [Kitasatospora sp. MMS16-BH015]|uniref:glycosyltransferase n=1 Tax=Kitasatospora sp. MMS16-BH015 TaxID=2018025 RepID=UPI001C2C0105|nr:glycosyltransferase [Kitasatospora sp. MMS16-BH015]
MGGTNARPGAGSGRPGQRRQGYVCFAAQDWWYHNRAHSDVQLMLNLARHRPVLFVNSIAMRMPLPGRSSQPLRRIIRKARSMARKVQRPVPGLPGFAVMTPVLLPFYGSARARALNAKLISLQVRWAARSLGMSTDVCVATIPTAADVVGHLRVRTLVYNRSDRHSAFPEADTASVERLERALMRDADHVLYVSSELMAAERELTGERAVFLDHGVDLEHFGATDSREPAEPAELAAIPHPRIGFFGALDDFVVDFDLLGRVAKEYPDAQLVLIGDTTADLGALTALPNVHHLGFRPYAEIPAYGRGFDVALMPWLDNDWVRHCNPIKLKEYLALGLPVVSTDFPEVRRYAEQISVADTTEGFLAAIGEALAAAAGPDADGAAQRRRAAVAGDSWQDRATDLLTLIEGEPTGTVRSS